MEECKSSEIRRTPRGRSEDGLAAHVPDHANRLDVSVQWRVEFGQRNPNALNHRVFVDNAGGNSFEDAFEKIGADGHFFTDDAAQGHVVDGVAERMRRRLPKWEGYANEAR